MCTGASSAGLTGAERGLGLVMIYPPIPRQATGFLPTREIVQSIRGRSAGLSGLRISKIRGNQTLPAALPMSVEKPGEDNDERSQKARLYFNSIGVPAPGPGFANANEMVPRGNKGTMSVVADFHEETAGFARASATRNVDVLPPQRNKSEHRHLHKVVFLFPYSWKTGRIDGIEADHGPGHELQQPRRTDFEKTLLGRAGKVGRAFDDHVRVAVKSTASCAGTRPAVYLRREDSARDLRSPRRWFGQAARVRSRSSASASPA